MPITNDRQYPTKEHSAQGQRYFNDLSVTSADDLVIVCVSSIRPFSYFLAKPLKRQQKINLKMPSAKVVRCIICLHYLTNLSIRQSDLDFHCLLERLFKHFSRRQKQTTFIVIGL